MSFFSSSGFRLILFYLILVAFACSPVWAVDYFINQDGSAHLYSSYLMLELIKGNPSVAETYALNSISVPNSSGHWLLVLLLNFFSPFLVTKIIVTLTFAGFVAAVGWLRWQTAGGEGVKTSLLIGAALGFNWLWFVGFYNFIIGACLFVLTLGLFYVWREKTKFVAGDDSRTAAAAQLFQPYRQFCDSGGKSLVSGLFLTQIKAKKNVCFDHSCHFTGFAVFF